MSEYSECFELARSAAINAGEIQKRAFGKRIKINLKGPKDLVTDIDRKCERLICKLIMEKFPSHGILAEESGYHNSSSPWIWIIDPLDGTTNFAHSYPNFCISIAFEEKGEIVFGVIYNPILDECFSSIKGTGAWLNDNPIDVSKTEVLENSLIATGGLAKMVRRPEIYFKQLENMAGKTGALRIDGSAALNMCYVAMGRYDGFWEYSLSPWDMAAGSLIVRAAGGHISTFSGGPFDMFGTELLCSNGYIHQEMIHGLRL